MLSINISEIYLTNVLTNNSVGTSEKFYRYCKSLLARIMHKNEHDAHENHPISICRKNI